MCVHSFYGISDRFGVNLLTTITVDLSDLGDHRFNHNYNRGRSVCTCSGEDKTSIRVFLYCPRFNIKCLTPEQSI